MIFKLVSLFLVAMGILAMFGKLTLPGTKRLASMKCASCGTFTFNKKCDCKGRK